MRHKETIVMYTRASWLRIDDLLFSSSQRFECIGPTMVIREVATTQEHHNYILAYADDIAQTAASEGELADIILTSPSKVEPIEDRSHDDG